MSEADDRALVDAFLKRRDERVFRSLYARHADRLYGLALRLLGGVEHEADDAVQETWLRAVRALPRFRWDSSLSTWLCAILIRQCRERWRDRDARHAAIDEREDAGAVDPRLIRLAERVDLARAIAALPDGYRHAIVLHDVEGYTHAEPARAGDVLERRIIERLRDEGEIAPAERSGWLAATRPALAIAAALVVFAAGMWVGEQRARPGAPAAAEEYMLLLYEDAAYVQPPAGAELERAAEYMQWAAAARDAGLAVTGDELTDDERSIEGVGYDMRVAPGLPAGRLAGFFLVGADDAQTVLDAVSTLPHLRYGGRVGLVRLAGH